MVATHTRQGTTQAMRSADRRRWSGTRACQGQVSCALVAFALLATVGVGTGLGQESFECLDSGLRTVSRIAGGTEAPADMAPWQVSLQRRRSSGNGWFHTCGGSLIHPSWVLTAAHCIDAGATADEISVVHGTKSLSSGGERRSVERLILHEDYERFNHDDIGLLRLSTPFSVTRSKTVQLQSRQLDQRFGFPGACAVITGWGNMDARVLEGGRLEPRSLPDRLLTVDVPVVDHETCSIMFDDLTAAHVCAGYMLGTRGTCRGDSGGPLVVPGGPTGWTQLGIVSFGKALPCGERTFTVYTRVSSYIDWILEQTSR